MTNIISIQLDIEGIVQGVGFRPFLFNLAKDFGLKGWILNRGNAGVRMRIEGGKDVIQHFIESIQVKKPPISRIDDIRITELQETGDYSSLEIIKSEDAKGSTIVLPADIATCKNCVDEMLGFGPEGKDSKYYMYPFVACATCGPRYTTVIDLPYDRDRTTMVDFPLCSDGPNSCISEYKDPSNRRFHAQTFACPRCGPHYKLVDADGRELHEKLDAIRECVQLIADGNIVAIKGIGGVHLVADARNDDAIQALRLRKKKRKFKPFALMAASLEMIREHAVLSRIEEEKLSSHRRPIVLLKKRENSNLSRWISPGLTSIGFMLPYMGTHHLIFKFSSELSLGPLVFTSGNVSGLPMAIISDDIIKQLTGIADYFLIHDRRIYQRCDDSVGKVIGKNFLLIRRSRGFVPEFIPSNLDAKSKVFIGFGAELHSTSAIMKGNKVFISQYIGDVTNLETLNYLDASIKHLMRLARIDYHDIVTISKDAHPLFLSSDLAKQWSKTKGVPLTSIYHHHAHCSALVLDNRIDPEKERIYVACDGVGYGTDGHAWGGEIFHGKLKNLKRVAHFKYISMPGGDACVKYPGRMLASFLHEHLDDSELKRLLSDHYLDCFPGGIQEVKIILNLLSRKDSLPMTSSTGRVLDSASVALKICLMATYEGEPAIRLEGLADASKSTNEHLVNKYFDCFTCRSKEGIRELDVSGAIALLVKESRGGSLKDDAADHARAFQIALGRLLGNEAVNLAASLGVNEIGFTGGVSYNKFIFSEIQRIVEENDCIFISHHDIPAGDSGISAGQVYLSLLRTMTGES
ncbi:MAG: carbamoyltransferase HypF [Promethearchaeota archaeon]